jgi:hypothetical protein
LRDFADRTQIRVQQHVRLFIKGFARREQLADFRLGVFVMQQRAMALMTHALPDLFRGRPQADDQCVRFETGEIFGIHRQAATGGNDRFHAVGQFRDNLLLERAKCRLAVHGKNVGDAAACLILDQLVGVEIIEVQLLGDEPAHGGFARAHETDERDVDEATGVVHGHTVAQGVPLAKFKSQAGGLRSAFGSALFLIRVPSHMAGKGKRFYANFTNEREFGNGIEAGFN